MGIKMDAITLRKVQLVQFDIAKEIDRLCVQNNINYFLVGGSLLGAVRHKGFIPWDDDLDIGMLRADYEKFLKIAPEMLDERYELIDWKSDPNYPHPMGKVIKKGTIYKESKRKDLGDQGIWVDVFPYDVADSEIGAFKRKIFKLKVLRCLIRAKCNYRTWYSDDGIIWSKYIKNLPFRLGAIFFSKDMLINKYEQLSHADSMKSDEVFENGTENYADWCFPKKFFAELIRMDFEDYQFYVPRNYHEYLNMAYGNYMTMPPVEERENRHLITEVYFGNKD